MAGKIISLIRRLAIERKIFLAVFGLGLLAFPSFTGAQTASFYLSPAQGTYYVGDTFFVRLLANIDGLSVNASQAKIYYPTDKLEITNISKSNSIFTLWVEEPQFSSKTGVFTFAGGLPNPGYMGSAGQIITLIFRAKAVGEAEVTLGEEKILANDSHGTDIFSSSRGAKYTIKSRPQVTPTTTPEVERPTTVVDNQPPYPFEILVDNEGDPTNPSPLLYFEAKDDLSGIGHYEIKVGENSFTAKPGETMPWRIPFLPPGSYRVSVKAFDKAGNSTESTAEVKVEPITTPKITICPKVFSSGEEVLYVGGIGKEKSTIIISFDLDGKQVKRWEAISDASGDWSFANDGLFKPGNYQITVRIKDGRGAMSNFSEPCQTKVVLNALIIGSWIISYKLFVILLLILLALLLILIFWLFGRTIRNRRVLERETDDLVKKFYKEYYELREDIRKQLEMYHDLRGKRKLSQKELEMEDSLLKNMKDVEEVMRKEIKDIENIR